MRKQPPQPPSFVPNVESKGTTQAHKSQASDIIKQEREYKLITPLFGGGVEPNHYDPITIVRGSEIRGLLRFWWRATRGGQYNGDPAEMKAAEDRIWGKAHTKDDSAIPIEHTVQIIVETPTSIKPKQLNPFPTTKEENRPVPQYAAFPLQLTEEERKKQNPPQKAVYSQISFTLTIIFPSKVKDDIEAALWAWETFGGIGARTRRGFGALKLLNIKGEHTGPLPPSRPQAVETWIRNQLKKFIPLENFPPGVPHLSSNVNKNLKVIKARDAIGAWESIIARLSAFRQSRGNSQNSRSRGRSHWPEAEAIRTITRPWNDRYGVLQQPHKFPRAAFGLPIIFHFKDRGDPADTTLQGATEGAERLASPLILRPFACAEQGAVAIAVLLEGNRLPPGGLVLKWQRGKEPVNSQLTRDEAENITPLNGEQDVLQAFMKSLGGN